jgi:hypothetical protein
VPIRKLYQRQHFLDAIADLRAWPAQHFEPECDVAGDIEMREQPIVLEDGVDRPLRRRQRIDAAFAQLNRTRIWAGKAGDKTQQGGLATSGRAENAQKLAFANVEINALQHPVAAEGLGETAQSQQNRFRFCHFQGRLIDVIHAEVRPIGWTGQFRQAVSMECRPNTRHINTSTLRGRAANLCRCSFY